MTLAENAAPESRPEKRSDADLTAAPGNDAEPIVHSAPVPVELRSLRGPMREIFERSQEVDLRKYEVVDGLRVANELCPAATTLVVDALQMMERVLELSSGVAETEAVSEADEGLRSYLPFERAVDVTMKKKLGSLRTIDDVAFVAQLELRQCRDRLERVRGSWGATVILGETDSALRRVRKSLAAVESAIARALGLAPLLEFTSELEVSLLIRRSYARFRRAINADDIPTAETLFKRFRLAGTQLAVLVGHDAYTEMRIKDRLLLRSLQTRILGWLETPRGEAAVSDGQQLWQDLAACAEMLTLVNRRSELIVHDRRQISKVLSRLREAPAELEAETVARLWSLGGLDPELDEMLPRIGDVSVARLKERLEALGKSLGPGGEGVAW